MSRKVLIANIYNSEYQKIDNLLWNYHKKGLTVNKSKRVVHNDRLIVYFLDRKNEKYKQTLNGMVLDDITGNYDLEDTMRLRF